MRTTTYIDIELARAPAILGCERMPFILLVAAVVFILVVVFGGITFHGLAGGLMLTGIGIAVLRRIGEHDPRFFAVYWQSMQLPRSLPATAPEPVRSISPISSMPFIGYGDRPRGQ